MSSSFIVRLLWEQFEENVHLHASHLRKPSHAFLMYWQCPWKCCLFQSHTVSDLYYNRLELRCLYFAPLVLLLGPGAFSHISINSFGSFFWSFADCCTIWVALKKEEHTCSSFLILNTGKESMFNFSYIKSNSHTYKKSKFFFMVLVYWLHNI